MKSLLVLVIAAAGLMLSGCLSTSSDKEEPQTDALFKANAGSLEGELSFEDPIEGVETDLVLSNEYDEELEVELDAEGKYIAEDLPEGNYELHLRDKEGHHEALVKRIRILRERLSRLRHLFIMRKEAGRERVARCMETIDPDTLMSRDEIRAEIRECLAESRPEISEECRELFKADASKEEFIEAGCPIPLRFRIHRQITRHRDISQECRRLYHSGATREEMKAEGCIPHRPEVSEECRELFQNDPTREEWEAAGCPVPIHGERDVSHDVVSEESGDGT